MLKYCINFILRKLSKRLQYFVLAKFHSSDRLQRFKSKGVEMFRKAKSDIAFVGICIGLVIGTLAGLAFTTNDKRTTKPKIVYVIRDFVSSAPSPHSDDSIEHIDEVSKSEEVEIENLRHYMHFDMSATTRLPEELKTDIIQEVILQSQTYEVDPKLVYAVLFTESRFRNNVKHQPTYVKQLKRKVQAIGMGGVVWDFWADYLIANTSLKEKKDLRNWRKNIEATAAILAFLSNYKMHPKAQDTKESAAIRYYGLHSVDYMESINLAYNRLKIWQS